MAAGLLAVAVLLLSAGCGDSSQGADGRRTLTVLAAASLTETFRSLAGEFEAEHPDVEVRLAFDSSATLAAQVAEGAPADVLATADAETMQTAAEAGSTAGEPAVFATNRLVLVVPPDNPADVTRMEHLDRPGVAYVTCVESAPCGSLASSALDAAGVSADPKSREVDVKAVLSKVVLDEADAGLVYATDAVAAGHDVEQVDVAEAGVEATPYLVAPVAASRQPELARAWVDLLLSAHGQEVLADAGFGRPLR